MVFFVVLVKKPDSMLVAVIRPVVLFFEGVLFYDYRKSIILIPVLGGVGLTILLFLTQTRLFNVGLIILFPYSIISIVLGLQQWKNEYGIFMISYEMYLLGWPIQQLIMWLSKNPKPLFNSFVAIPLDIAGGFIVYSITEWMMNVIKKVRKNKK